MMWSLLLVVLVYFVFLMFFYKKGDDMEGMSSYECGFDPFSLTRLTFSYRFYLISILFIIFDVEISLMLPVPFIMSMELGSMIFYMFVLILVVGLLYEYYCGSLDWLDNFHN